MISALRKAIGLAESSFPVTPGQWVDAVDSGLKPPSSLIKNLDDVPLSGLTQDQKIVVREAKEWAATYRAADDAIERLTGVSTGIPDDAIQLVILSRIKSGGDAFDQYVDDLAARMLKKQTCALGREYIDAATAQYADQSDSGGFSDILDSFLLEIEMEQDLSAKWVNPAGWYVNLETLADDIVAQAKDYAEDYLVVLDSPNGGVAMANFTYLRICVLR